MSDVKPVRKIIQITVDQSTESNVWLFCLCDDGSLWKWAWCTVDRELQWRRVDTSTVETGGV